MSTHKKQQQTKKHTRTTILHNETLKIRPHERSDITRRTEERGNNIDMRSVCTNNNAKNINRIRPEYHRPYTSINMSYETKDNIITPQIHTKNSPDSHYNNITQNYYHLHDTNTT